MYKNPGQKIKTGGKDRVATIKRGVPFTGWWGSGK